MSTPTPRMSTMLPNSVTVGEKSPSSRIVAALINFMVIIGVRNTANFAVKTDSRSFQSQLQFLGMAGKKTFDCNHRHTLPVFTGGGDGLGDRMVRHDARDLYRGRVAISTAEIGRG